MKKLLIVLAILLVAGAGAFAQEVTVGGEFMGGFIAQGNPLASTMHLTEAELNVTGMPDDYTTVALEMDFEDGALPAVAVDDFRVSSDVFGALGLDLPVSMNLTVGYFDTYFNGWNYVTRSGEEYYYAAAAGAYLWTMGPTTNGAWAWDIGFGDFGLHYWNSWNFGNMAVAFSGAVSVLNFWVGYAGDFAAIGSGAIWVEAGANVDLGMATLFIPASFAYDLGGSAFSWSSGVKAGVMDMLTISVGVGGETGQAFRYIIPEVSARPLDGLDVYAIAKVDLASAVAVFHSIDVGASYMLGALKVNPGVVIGLDPTSWTSIAGDKYGVTGTGFYLSFHTNF